jgi:MFS family permease
VGCFRRKDGQLHIPADVRAQRRAATFVKQLEARQRNSHCVCFLCPVRAAGELPATIIGAVAVDSIGRRPTIGTGLLLTGVACCVCSLLSPGFWSTALAALGKSACSSAWSLAYIYAAELMPTSVRSAALAGSNQAAR